jgi:hypothetical protein
MPAQKGLGGDQEGSPTLPREQAAERRQESLDLQVDTAHVRGVDVREYGPGAGDHDLDIFVRLASPAGHNKSEDATHAEVEEGEGHDG